MAQRQVEISREKESIAHEGVQAGRVSTLDYAAAKFATREVEAKLEAANIDLVSTRMEQFLLSARNTSPAMSPP